MAGFGRWMGRSVGSAVLATWCGMGLAGCSHPRPVAYYPPPPPPPAVDGSPVYQQGLQDGFEAARRDVAAQQPPVFERHPRFRNPPVPPPAQEEYRAAFRDGYQQFLRGGAQGTQGAPPPAY